MTRSLTLPVSHRLAISSTGRLVAAAGRNVVIADLRHRTRLGSHRPFPHPSELAFGPAEDILAVKSTAGEIAILSIEDGKVVRRFSPEQKEEGAELLFSASGEHLVDAIWSGKIRVWRSLDLGQEQELTFPGEMIKSISANADRSIWLFAHQPITPGGENFSPPPYLTVWDWPLTAPKFTVSLGLDHLHAVEQSPCGKYIAATGFIRQAASGVLRLATIAGELIADAPWEYGGTTGVVRWAQNSTLLGTANRDGFDFLDIPNLQCRKRIALPYPSDLAFVPNGHEVVLGTWERGKVAELGVTA